jgi:dienelactone hydrolase
MPTKPRKITTVLIRCRYAAIRCASLLAVAPGLSMHSIKKIFFALVWFTSFGLSAASAQSILGARGAESDPNRRQQWLVPSPDLATPAHAVLFRPNGDGPFPLAVIAHATTQNVLRRAQMPQPEYRALAAFLVARGFAVLVPERLGHGGTGGRYQEDQGGCDEADYWRAGRATADQIAAAMNFLRQQAFIRPDRTLVVGHSAGGWGALALGEDVRGVSAIVVFAPGRGGHANDLPNQICAPRALLASAAGFGKANRVPVTWLVAANDSYFSPAFSRRLAEAFRDGGGKVDFHELPPYGSEGHWLAESENGVKLASRALDAVLKGLHLPADKEP